MKTRSVISKLRNLVIDYHGDKEEIRAFLEYATLKLVPYAKKTKNKRPKFFDGSYEEYLNSELWKKIKTKIYETRPAVCEACGSTSYLNVHHTVYTEKVMAGGDLSKLKIMCRSCHILIHSIVKTDGLSIKKATNTVILYRGKLTQYEKRAGLTNI